MWSLLLKPKNLLIVAGLLLVAYSFYAFNRISYLKSERTRIEENYTNALQKDSLETVIYTIKKEHEIEAIVNQVDGLKELVDKSEVKLKRMQGLYYQELKNKNTTDQNYDISGMVDSIIKNISVTRRWIDSTKCQITGGYVSYDKGSLKVGVDMRETINKIALIKHEGRRKKVKWLLGLRLGKRPLEFTPETDCGEIKVTVIEKQD